MIHLNKLTDYALLILSEMSLENMLSAKKISELTHIPLATTNKILKLLSKSKLCLSKNGKNGGFLLAKSPQEINLLEVINSIEETKSFSVCASNGSSCQLQNHCKINKKIKTLNNEIMNLLKNKTISDLCN